MSNELRATGAPGWLVWLPVALLVGAAAGAWVAADALIVHRWFSYLKFGSLLRWLPYTVTAVTLLLLVAVLWLALNRDRAWGSRSLVAMALVMLASHMGGIGGGLLNPLMGAILVFATVWFLDRMTTPAAPWQPTPFLWIALALVCAALLSMIGRHPSEVFAGFAAFAAKFALMLLLADFIDDFRIARAAVLLLVAAATLFAVIGIAQVLVYMMFGIDYSLSDIDYRFGQSPFGPSLRASGLSRTANQYAPPLVAAGLIALSFSVSARRFLPKLACAVIFLLALTAVFLSIVRGSWFALALGILLLPFIHRPNLSLHWAGLAVVVGTVAFASGFVTMLLDAIVGLSAAGTAERWELLVAGIATMIEHPTGAGIQNFATYSPSFERYPVHNLFGQMASELGVPGLLAMGALVGYVALHLAMAIRASRAPEHRALLCAVLTGYIGLIAATQSEPMAFSQFLFIYMGLAEACARTSLAESSKLRSPAEPGGRSGYQATTVMSPAS